MGGEKSVFLPFGLIQSGSPPHGRGKGSCKAIAPHPARITPAWAGKRPAAGQARSNVRDHPRMGGEKSVFLPFGLIQSGSPPHGRGKVRIFAVWVNPIRITPAWAGKRQLQSDCSPSCQDHPRMGGEKASGGASSKQCQGSPPHGRGKENEFSYNDLSSGITPA